jgi:hypothetical protein
MKQAPNPPGQQMNLWLPDQPAATVPDGKHEELTQALMELLINAAQNTTEFGRTESAGGRSESKAHA